LAPSCAALAGMIYKDTVSARSVISAEYERTVKLSHERKDVGDAKGSHSEEYKKLTRQIDDIDQNIIVLRKKGLPAEAKVRALLRQACHGGEGLSCMDYFNVIKQRYGIPQSQIINAWLPEEESDEHPFVIARKLLEKSCSAEASRVVDCYEVGMLHAQGEGGPRDLVKAKYYLNIACSTEVPESNGTLIYYKNEACGNIAQWKL
jgi:TPR repeat protein